MNDHIIKLKTILKDKFNILSFRPAQEQSINSLLKGDDVFAIMPTGSGKSLIYQITTEYLKGQTLIISPLIALMQDQVKELEKYGLRGSYINSTVQFMERKKRLERFQKKEINYLFITPERFKSPDFLKIYIKLKLSLFVVDEAHCISAWGHDFRPDYRLIADNIEKLETRPPVLALTATANPSIKKDIVSSLKLKQENIYFSGVERENLHIKISTLFSEEKKIEWLIKMINSLPGPGIIYVSLIKTLEKVRQHLQLKGLDPLIYHGELPRNIRIKNQDKFINSTKGPIIATNAFGMGINKKNIRYIIHWEIPGSVEAYYQEIGRAGRDQKPSFCLLLHNPDDLFIQREFMENRNPDYGFIKAIYNEILQPKFTQEPTLKQLNHNFSSGKWDHRTESVVNILLQLGLIKKEQGYYIRTEQELNEETEKYLKDKKSMSEKKLFDINNFVSFRGCKTAFIERYFIGSSSITSCKTCDFCMPDDQEWNKIEKANDRLEKKDKPVSIERKKGSYNQGGWIDVKGIGICEIKQVKSNGTLLIERADNLKQFTINPKSQTIKML